MNKKKNDKYFFTKSIAPAVALAAFILAASACSNNKYDNLYPSGTTVCDTARITSAADIVPIIASNCYNPGNGCHDAVGARTSGYDYTTYNGVVVNVKDGALLSDINWAPTTGHNNMPKNGSKLAQCDINKITRWINEGYPNN